MAELWYDRKNFCYVPRCKVHSRQLVIGRFEYKSHYAYEVAERYLRRYRINIVTFHGARTLREYMAAHFERRDIYVHDDGGLLPFDLCKKDHWGETRVCVNGERTWIPYSQLHGLQSRLRKDQKLGDWDFPHVMKRLADLCLQRREREHGRLAALAHQFKCLLRAPHHKRSERAAYLLELFSERI